MGIGQTPASAQYPDPFLTLEETPAGTWVPEPPSMLEGSFADDFYYYQWGVAQRSDNQVAAQALSDESAELIDVFSQAFGFTISYTSTPEIALLVETAASDATQANKRLKDQFQRTRPFATFNQPSLKDWTDEEEAITYSYPSGHASRGYMTALVLSTVAPERTDALMERAVTYAMNRIVCGHHWKSDINASLLLQAAIFANIVVSDAYQQQLAKARAEYQQLKAAASSVSNVSADDPSNAAPVLRYDLQGRRLSGHSTHGVQISKNKKVIR